MLISYSIYEPLNFVLFSNYLMFFPYSCEKGFPRSAATTSLCFLLAAA